MPDEERIQATVVITTKNRKEELRQAIDSALAQRGARVEVLVIDDGSTDGTTEMVRREYPGVRLDRVEKSLGYIAERNRGAELARGPIIFSIDDDAAFSTPDVVAQALAEFDHPRVGAVAIPFINVNYSPEVFQKSPDPGRVWVAASYIGTAHALRRDLFLRLSGYRAFLIHQGEESDYCVRMLGAGHVVRLGSSDPIHHFESPRRDMRRMDYYGRRNDLIYAWCNSPAPWLPIHAVGTTVKGLLFALKVRRPWHAVRGLAAGWAGFIGFRRERKPVHATTYRLSRQLKKRGPALLSEIEQKLRPLAAADGA